MNIAKQKAEITTKQGDPLEQAEFRNDVQFYQQQNQPTAKAPPSENAGIKTAIKQLQDKNPEIFSQNAKLTKKVSCLHKSFSDLLNLYLILLLISKKAKALQAGSDGPEFIDDGPDRSLESNLADDGKISSESASEGAEEQAFESLDGQSLNDSPDHEIQPELHDVDSKKKSSYSD